MGKIKFGIIGTSKITRKFLEAALKSDRFELVGIYSRDLEKAKNFGEEFGAKYFFDDIEEFSKSKEFEAVYIASPNYMHKLQSIKCLEGKKHVLCEKTMGVNLKEVETMIGVAKKNKVLLMEAMIITCLPGFLKVKENLYKIGDIKSVYMNFCQYSSRYDNFKKGIIENAFKREIGTGAVSDIGVYCIEPIVNLFGSPKKVYGTGELLHTGTDGRGSGILKYEGFDALINYSKVSNSYIPCEIVGDVGSFIISNILFEEVKIIYRDGKEEIITTKDDANNMIYELEEFINCIENKTIESKKNTHKTSVESIKVIDKIRKDVGVIYNGD